MEKPWKVIVEKEWAPWSNGRCYHLPLCHQACPINCCVASVLTASGRGRRGRKAVPPVAVPLRSLMTEAPVSNDLGYPPSDEEDSNNVDQSDLLLPVPNDRSIDTGVVIKSEPIEGIEDSASENVQLMPSELEEHSYSYADYTSLSSSGQHYSPQTVEEPPSSRTSGHKYARDEHDYYRSVLVQF